MKMFLHQNINEYCCYWNWKKEDEANWELTDKENFQRHVENWGKK